jgi:hypothetical protein
MTTGRSTAKGGRPPDRGGSAKPQLRIEGRRYADTPKNRKRFGLPVSGVPSQPAGKAPSAPLEGQTAVSGPSEAFATNEAAVRLALTAGQVPAGAAPGQAAPLAQPAEIVISYTEVVKIGNTFLTAYVAKYAMLPNEEIAIGQALDAVIAKHFPALRNAGPELALTIAVAGYAVRVFVMPMLHANGLSPEALG